MSTEQTVEAKPEQKKDAKDEVKIGNFIFKINRNVDWPTMTKLTREASTIESFRKNPKGELMLEMAERSDKWVIDVFENFLIDFKMDSLKGIAKETVNDKAATVFWAVRSNLSFLAVESPDMLSTAQPKTSQ
jgi:hypothetical protein